MMTEDERVCARNGLASARGAVAPDCALLRHNKQAVLPRMAVTCEILPSGFKLRPLYSGVDRLGSLTDLHAQVLAQKMPVESLTLDFSTFHSLPLEVVPQSLQDTLQILQYCAPTLTSLRLDGFCMEDLTTAGQAGSEDSVYRGVLEVLGACKALRSLYISCARASVSAGSSTLLMQLAASLPELRTLQWRCARQGAHSLPENHFSEEFVSLIASTDNVGLQLLQVENCTFGGMPFSLPGTLRILSLKCEQAPLENQLSTLLRDCHSLEELYLTAFATSSAQPPDLSVLLPNVATLRSLVIDVPGMPMTISERVPESLDPCVVFPVLDVIVITNVCNCIDELPSRCPMLCALGLTMTDSDFFFPVVKSHMNPQGCTLQHLQLCLALDLFVLVEHHVWESVGHISSLLTLQLIFADYDNQQDLDEQMLRLFDASFTVEGLCMPNLQHVALYLEPEPTCAGAHFQYNPRDAGACKVLSRIGSMVAAGIWPSLAQIDLHPCVNVLDGAPYEGPGPAPEGVPGLAVSMFADRGEAYGTEPGLRSFIGACNCPRVSRAMASLKRA